RRFPRALPLASRRKPLKQFQRLFWNALLPAYRKMVLHKKRVPRTAPPPSLRNLALTTLSGSGVVSFLFPFHIGSTVRWSRSQSSRCCRRLTIRNLAMDLGFMERDSGSFSYSVSLLPLRFGKLSGLGDLLKSMWCVAGVPDGR